MKKYADWKGELRDFVQPGDQIDQEMFDYFLGVVYPRVMQARGFLMGEPVNTLEDGEGIYDAYDEIDGKFYYKGLMTLQEFVDGKEVSDRGN